MKTNQIPFSTILWMAFLVTACSGAATPDVMMDKPGDTMAAQATPTSDAMMAQETPTPDTMMAQETPIVDAMSNPTATPSSFCLGSLRTMNRASAESARDIVTAGCKPG